MHVASHRALWRERLVAFRVFRTRRGAHAASHRALWRERLVAFRVFRSRRVVVLCFVVVVWCVVLFCLVLCCVQAGVGGRFCVNGVGGRVWAE